MNFERIVTDRLYLDLINKIDTDFFFYYKSIPDVSRYQGWVPGSYEDAVEFIDKYSSDREIKIEQWKQAGIYLREDRQLLGDLGFCFFEEEQVEIGFTLAPEFQGNGYAAEAVGGLLKYLFNELNALRIVASTDPANINSIKLLKKFKFRQEGYFLQSVKIRGEWKDDLRFALLKSEWNL